MDSSTGENEKRLLASILKERLVQDKNLIIYKELLEQEMPLFLKNFLQNRVQKYFYTDEPFQIKNSNRYDFNYERIKELKQELKKAFEEATLFTKEEIIEIINRTVGLQFDLLINPKKTLVKIFYKDKSERTQKDILQILNGIIDSRLFIRKLKEKIDEFDKFHILKDDFNKIVKQTLDEIYNKDVITAFIYEVKAFLEFVSHIKGTEEKTINKEILFLLLDERNLEQYREAFNSTSNNSDWLEVDEIKSMLTSFQKNLQNVIKEDRLNEIEDDLEDFIVSAIEYPASEENEKDEKSTFTELMDDTSVSEEQITEGQKHYPIIEAWKEPQDFIINRSMIEYQPNVPLQSLDFLIDEKSKKLIQKKIFKKDEIAYDIFIKRLEEVDSWKEAKQIIDDELMLRDIRPFSKEALKLGDLIFNRYFPKKH